MAAPAIVDLISDTSTKPTAGMRAAMAAADVGDEQRGEDPTVNELCERVAGLLGMEAALYLPSGIMSNLVAVLVHCRPGDEIITAGNAHVIGSEGAGAAAIAGALFTTIAATDGRFTAAEVAARIRPQRPRSPRTRLVCIEQTSNRGGGTVWSAETISEIADLVHARGLALHVDGARLLNAAIAASVLPAHFTSSCDSAWLDLSKGLGCPVGSVLAGSRDFIDEAWIWKHRLGGAMRQAGVLAAAGLYALDHHVDRLAIDHDNAARFAAQISRLPGVRLVFDTVETNIVYFDVLDTGRTAKEIATSMLAEGVRIGAINHSVLRAVTHLDVSSADIDTAVAVLTGILEPS